MILKMFLKEDGAYATQLFEDGEDAENAFVPDDFRQMTTHIFKDFDPSSIDHFDKLYVENGVLKYDANWEQVLMPIEEIGRKHRARCLREIQAEIEKESPDFNFISKRQHEFEYIKHCYKQRDKKYFYETAKKNLLADGHQKSLIIEKLNQKIDEL